MNGSDEQTEILRAIWNQMSDMNRSLNARLERLDSRLAQFASQTNQNLARHHRNSENMHEALRALIRRDARVEELDARLTRVEKHVGLSDT
jgi:uncharacterized coiled-coil protein SlyX